MYENYKKCIQLWANTHVPVPQNKGSSATISSSTDGGKSSEVDQVYEQLIAREKHKENRMQLRMWAYLITMGKHASVDEPPDKLSFLARDQPLKLKTKRPPRYAVCPNSSPSTNVFMRTQLRDQLEKWKKLHTDGIIDDNEYKELRESILTDIRNL